MDAALAIVKVNELLGSLIKISKDRKAQALVQQIQSHQLVIQTGLMEANAKINKMDSDHARAITEIRENCRLQTEQLKQEIAQFKTSQIKAQMPGDTCPFCRRQTGDLQRMEPHPLLGLHGISNGYYKCSACGKTYQKQINAGVEG